VDELKVLLIDDEEELVTALVERLEYRGIAADYALEGYAALEKLRTGAYKAVVLDLKLPGMEGTEVLRRIVSEYPGVPVLLITGHGSAMETVEPGPGGAFDCLMKPVKIEVLVQRIREAVARK
jgi:DNA-binding response OmpR family regulator